LAEVVNAAFHILNRVFVRPILKKNPYELYKDRKPKISYFRAFGCKCFVLNNGKDNLGKFDPKSDEGACLGYSPFNTYLNQTLIRMQIKCIDGICVSDNALDARFKLHGIFEIVMLVAIMCGTHGSMDMGDCYWIAGALFALLDSAKAVNC